MPSCTVCAGRGLREAEEIRTQRLRLFRLTQTSAYETHALNIRWMHDLHYANHDKTIMIVT